MADSEEKKGKVVTFKQALESPKAVVVKETRDALAGRVGVETSPIPEKRKERARETIAFMLVFGFLALLLSSFLFAGTVDEAIKLIQAISSALSGLIGAVLGYYYGTSITERSAKDS